MTTRKFSRVKFNVEATIRSGERSFRGWVENLSMTGLFLVTEERLPEGEHVEIEVELTGSMPLVTVSCNGRVLRATENGIAFVFEKLELESYLHLKNIVSYNLDDPDKVMEEICHSIDEKLAAAK
ncbi:MAG TPA: PilZ domain-containing protein [Desulfuromonadales bacterium]|nr:PilZ domain-containing protein [Desulfuromonadales bacterium]